MNLKILLDDYDKNVQLYHSLWNDIEKDCVLGIIAGLEVEIRQAAEEYFKYHSPIVDENRKYR